MEKLQQIASQFADRIRQHMGVACTAEVTATDEVPSIRLIADGDGSILIGKNGQTLSALENVLRLIVARHIPGGRPPVLDINGYRRARAEQSALLARQAAERVRATGKAEALEPMSAYERRTAHMVLASEADITTESIGSDPVRRVVVKPAANLL